MLQEELQEREAEWAEEQAAKLREKRQQELEAHKRQQEVAERAASKEAAEEDAQALLKVQRQAQLRADLVAREEAALQLSYDALQLMKE